MMWKTVQVRGQTVHEKALYLPLNLAMNLNLF